MHGLDIADIPSWLRANVESERRDEVFKLGLITGLREKKGVSIPPTSSAGSSLIACARSCALSPCLR
jgi:hypothetical protein